MSDTEMAVPEIMTVEEVAHRLRCSKAHVCNAINGKVNGVTTLPAISMGRRKLIRVSALAAWLAQNEPAGGNAMIPACGIEAVGASKGKHDA
jgi:excisionase family DNA binding protein